MQTSEHCDSQFVNHNLWCAETINIKVLGVLCYYWPADFDIYVVGVSLCENGKWKWSQYI